MKKTLISALTTALVVGAASTTFAAANPFSDVPADSWAYNAVATLAKDGVVNGFPNGTFQGQKTMTRYEMAQIVAKAMAYENMTKADKAIVDKLAAEFADELNNLGVRVSNLENKVDNVKLTGKIEYTYKNPKWKDVDQDKHTTNELMFRFEPSAQINDKWTAKSRIDYTVNPSDDSDNNGKVKVDRIYAEGNVGNESTVMLGKYPAFLGNGLVFDSKLSGAAGVFGDKTTLTVAAGRYNEKDYLEDHNIATDGIEGYGKNITTDAYVAQVDHHFSDKVTANAGFMTLRGMDLRSHENLAALFDDGNENGHNNIWYVGARAEVAPLLHLNADYAKASLKMKKGDITTSDKKTYTNKSAQDKAYSVELAYRGEDPKDAGSYGVFAAYRNLGGTAAVAPTYDAIDAGQKGMEYGVAYVPAENIITTVKYFDGKNLDTDKDVRTFWARAEFLF